MKKVFKTAALALLILAGTSSSTLFAQTASKEVEVVNKMLQAFGSGNMEELKKTLSDNTSWNYPGSEIIPYAGTYTGKEGAVKFISNIISNVDILDFKVKEIVSQGKTVVVLGFEKQKIKKNSKIIEQDWVQVYTVENGLITRMDEYANTAAAEKLFK